MESDLVSRIFSSGSTEWNAGPSASELLYDAGRAARRWTTHRPARAATRSIANKVLSAFRDVEDQLSALRRVEQEAAAQQRAVDAARRSTELSTLRYKRGLATYLEVLTNQTIQLNDERASAALVARRIVASANSS